MDDWGMACGSQLGCILLQEISQQRQTEAREEGGARGIKD